MQDNSFVDFIGPDDPDNDASGSLFGSCGVNNQNYLDQLYYRKDKILELLANLTGVTLGISDNEIVSGKTWSSLKIKAELDKKVDKVVGKELSTNDYTDIDKELVDDIPVIKTDLDFLKNTLSVHPTYTAPTASISNSPSIAGLEVGQVINITINTNFTKNDAGNSTGIQVKKDGVVIGTTSPYVDNNVVMTTTPKVYQSTVTYSQGIVKNNNFGDPDPVGRIEAGTVNSNSISYRGYYLIPYGSVISIPTTSAQARALPQSQLSSASNTITLRAEVGMLYQVLYLPVDKDLVKVIDLDALNLDITAEYVKISDTFTINDIGGTPRPYKAYVRSQSVSYTSRHNHQITLTNI